LDQNDIGPKCNVTSFLLFYRKFFEVTSRRRAVWQNIKRAKERKEGEKGDEKNSKNSCLDFDIVV
jgi:hypothetical protein